MAAGAKTKKSRTESCGNDGPVETVAFVRRDDVFDWKPAIAQRDYDLISLAFVDPWIVGALHDQQRRLDLVR